MNKKVIIPILILLVAIGAGATYILTRTDSELPEQSTSSTAEEKNDVPEVEVTEIPEQTTNTPSYDLLTPSSTTFIANKSRPLPADYVPDDLITPNVKLRLGAGAEQMQFRAVAHDDLKAMFAAAQADGVTLVFGSGYRSYSLQKQFYDGYVARDGVAAADRYSARPGTSEHQTGLSFDVTSPNQTCHLEICFEDTEQGEWMAENAHKYGFVLRYPDGKEAITGYQYEPWHFRYLGEELAIKIHSNDITVEEYFELN